MPWAGTAGILFSVSDSPLQDLNDQWWDWVVQSWDGWCLRLIADNDLTYHHAVEVDFLNVAYVRLPMTVFSHPRFRAPTPEELTEVTPFMHDEDAMRVFAWDTDEAEVRCLVVAEKIAVRRGLVPTHSPPAAP